MAERPLFSNCPFLRFVREFIHFEDEAGAAKVPYSTLLPFVRYVRPLWRVYTAGLVCGLAVSLLTMALPLATKFFVDNIVLGKDTGLPSGLLTGQALTGPLTAAASPVLNSLYLLVLAIGVIGVLIVVFNVLQSYYNVTFAEEYTFLLQTDLYHHVLRFPLQYFRDSSTGYLLSRLTDDVVYLHYIFSGYLSQIVVQLVSLALIFILAALSLTLTLALLLFTPLFVVVNLVFIPRVRALGYRGREQSANVTRDLGEIIAGIEQVKADSAEEREYGHLLATIRDAIRNRVTSTVYMSLSGQVSYGVKSLALLVLFWFGGQEVMAGTMTLGDFVAFAAYVATFSSLLSSVISSPITLQPAVVSAARISEILALAPEEEPESGYCPDCCAGHLRCEDVGFAYVPGTPVLDGLCLDVPPGRVVGIIGRTGAGKTTLINLLLKFYTPQAGRITLDGVGIAGLDSRWLRREISFVSQNPYLFHATIEENIRYSRPEADFEDVVLAARRAEVHDDIMRMPDGYRTVVGERGAKLSGGQRQRIGLARAFLKDSPILVLDEPMSHLDADIQVELLMTLSELIRGRTTIFVTHHERMLALADEVYRVVDGRLELAPGPLSPAPRWGTAGPDLRGPPDGAAP
jgi:ABC-type bacteriocin/lantibiotic exporter with double-glycine peptidase domain